MTTDTAALRAKAKTFERLDFSGRMMGLNEILDAIPALLDELDAHRADAERRKDISARLREAYERGRTVTDAMVERARVTFHRMTGNDLVEHLRAALTAALSAKTEK